MQTKLQEPSDSPGGSGAARELERLMQLIAGRRYKDAETLLGELDASIDQQARELVSVAAPLLRSCAVCHSEAESHAEALARTFERQRLLGEQLQALSTAELTRRG